MRKRFLCLCLACTLAFGGYAALAATGSEIKDDFLAPHDAMPNAERLAEKMPDEFSIEALPYKTLIASEDFTAVGESTDSLKMETGKIGEGYNISYDNGAVKIVGKPDAPEGTACHYSFSMKYTGEITPGEYYAFKCKIKTESVTASPGNRIAAYKDKTWLNDAGGNYGRYKEMTGTNEYTMTQLIKPKDGANELYLTAYYNSGSGTDTGTVWFDDFELYHVLIDPMEAVLIKPNYKGIIYGDGDADINWKVSVKESAFYSYDDLSLSVELTDGSGNIYKRSDAQTVGSLTSFVFSSRGLAEGDYYLQTVLKNEADGKIISQKELTLRKRTESYRPKNYVDDDGYLVRNGERALLTRLYSGDNIDVSAEAAKTVGIDNVAAYGWWWAYNDGHANYKKAETLRDLGIRSHINLKEAWYGTQRVRKNGGTIGPMVITSMEETIPFLYKVAEKYKNDAVLDGYGIFDEINPVISGDELAWGNEILAWADIDNPTYGVANQYKDHYGIYTDIVDILTVDPYPIRGTDADGENISNVGKDVKNIKESFPNRPIGATLQGFFYSPANDKALRSPNRQELLNMMWQALCEGATVIEWYSYDSMMNSDVDAQQEKEAAEEEHEKYPEIPLRVVEVKSDEEWLADFNAVFGELNEYENILLSSEPVPNYSVTGGGDWLNIMLKRHEGKTYIFAVNNTKESHAATVEVQGAGNYDLSFDALEVKKIEILQSDFLSPEAELKGLGFYNGEEVFAVAEGEENILYVNENSGVINYCADISDGAKLYFGQEMVPEKGKITVKLAEEFTVTVVAADGVTKTNKNYKIVKQ